MDVVEGVLREGYILLLLWREQLSPGSSINHE